MAVLAEVVELEEVEVVVAVVEEVAEEVAEEVVEDVVEVSQKLQRHIKP